MQQGSVNLLCGLIWYQSMECLGQKIQSFCNRKLHQVIHQYTLLACVQLHSYFLYKGNWPASCHLWSESLLKNQENNYVFSTQVKNTKMNELISTKLVNQLPFNCWIALSYLGSTNCPIIYPYCDSSSKTNSSSSSSFYLIVEVTNWQPGRLIWTYKSLKL